MTQNTWRRLQDSRVYVYNRSDKIVEKRKSKPRSPRNSPKRNVQSYAKLQRKIGSRAVYKPPHVRNNEPIKEGSIGQLVAQNHAYRPKLKKKATENKVSGQNLRQEIFAEVFPKIPREFRASLKQQFTQNSADNWLDLFRLMKSFNTTTFTDLAVRLESHHIHVTREIASLWVENDRFQAKNEELRAASQSLHEEKRLLVKMTKQQLDQTGWDLVDSEKKLKRSQMEVGRLQEQVKIAQEKLEADREEIRRRQLALVTTGVGSVRTGVCIEQKACETIEIEPDFDVNMARARNDILEVEIKHLRGLGNQRAKLLDTMREKIVQQAAEHKKIEAHQKKHVEVLEGRIVLLLDRLESQANMWNNYKFMTKDMPPPPKSPKAPCLDLPKKRRTEFGPWHRELVAKKAMLENPEIELRK